MKKAKLLKKLRNLGYHESGRKIRSDKGESHAMSNKPRKTRSDKGILRAHYDKHTPAFNKKVFDTLITSNFDAETGEDLLQRDDNGIFPPHITHYYKKITTPGNVGTYRSSQRRTHHPEQLRWRWWISEYENAKMGAEKKRWATHLYNWYFILEKDILFWTYEEWAWAYFTQIGGHLNSPLRSDPFIELSYNRYLAGDYGRPNRDKHGHIIWERS